MVLKIAIKTDKIFAKKMIQKLLNIKLKIAMNFPFIHEIMEAARSM